MGEKTRASLKQKAGEIGDELEEKYQSEIEQLKPEMGEKTRASLKQKASEIGDELEEKYQSEIEQLKAKISSLKGDVEQVAENITK